MKDKVLSKYIIKKNSKEQYYICIVSLMVLIEIRGPSAFPPATATWLARYDR